MTDTMRKRRPRTRKDRPSEITVIHPAIEGGTAALSSLPLVSPPPQDWNGDLNGDMVVNNADLLACIAQWGVTTDVRWLHAVIRNWGPVPVPPSTPQVAVLPIHLGNGATTVANKSITGDTGIVGDNATSVTTLYVSNVTINSTNYGVYLGSCDNANFDRVNITCSPTGGDSYSVRGTIRRFDSKDSKYRSGIKAFRIYGCLGGSSLRDEISGDRLMLGGGYANEWVSPGPFENFAFTDGKIDVNSVEIYDATHHVTFNGMDFAGTGHISIQFGAHHITFAHGLNMPEIKYFDFFGNRYNPTAAQLAERNIAFTN